MKCILSLKIYQDALTQAGLVKRPVADSDVLNTPISHITYHSKEAGPGTLFVCKGAAFKDAYLAEALAAGAIAWISEREMDRGEGIVVSDVRKAMACLANLWFEEPWRSFPLIGLTGTKGKTTALYALKNIIDGPDGRAGTVGYLSSIETYDGKQRFESHLTTPEALVLAQHFDHVRTCGLWGMVMEVSSQALKYDRTLGVEFDMGCFLNFGIDHIGESEHEDEEDYFSSKLRFFDQCKVTCINAETDGFDRVLKAAEASSLCERVLLYSPSGHRCIAGRAIDYAACDIGFDGGYPSFSLHRRVREDANRDVYEDLGRLHVGLRGRFNVENALVAAIIALEFGFDMERIRSGLAEMSVPGRMEVFENRDRGIVAVVDYAHNRMSFERLYSSLRADYPGWRIEALFGCPGGKGLQRREELPEIVAKYADFAWITEEDAGEEDVAAISEQLRGRLSEAGVPVRVVLDRIEAIRAAIDSAKPNTVIVLTGKGRENYQKRGREYVSTPSDVDIVLEHL